MDQMELVESLREKTGCSYSEAKAAMDETGGNLLEAPVYWFRMEAEPGVFDFADVDDLIRRATNNVQKGDIILFHNDSKYILDALPTILKTYQQQGFTMIPAREILLEGATTIDVQGKQHPVASAE